MPKKQRRQEHNTHHHHHHHHYSGDWNHKQRYAYRAGSPGPGPNRHHLRRNIREKSVAGVCAGLADYFGWNLTWLRIGWVFISLAFFPMPILAYFALAVILKPENEYDRMAFSSPDEERFWRTFSKRPSMTFSELKHRFRALEKRISNMEYTVTSDEYGLKKAFNDIERE